MINEGADRSAEPPLPATVGRTVAVAALLALLAAAFRFWRLGDWSFWADEVATLRDAQSLRQVITYPVGYALIGLAVDLLGSSEFVARLVPAIVGTISVPAIYLVGRKLFTERAAILSAALLAISSYHIFFSQFARYYTLLMLLGMLGMWCAFAGLERNDRKWLLGAVFLLALAGWTHWSAALGLPGLAIYALWCSRSGRKPSGLHWANLTLLFAPFIIGGIALARPILWLWTHWRTEAGFSLARSGLTALKLADRLEPAALIFAAIAAWLLVRGRDRRGRWLLSYALAPPLLAVVFVGLTEGGSRFALVSLPAFLLLAGEGLDVLIRHATAGQKKVAWVLVALVLLSFGLKDGLYYTVQQGQRPRWREAISYVAKSSPPGSVRVMASAPEIASYYLPLMTAKKYRVDSIDLAELRKTVNAPVIYVIVEHTANVAPTADLLAFLQARGSLERTFPLRVRFLDYSLSVYRVPPATQNIENSPIF